MTRDDGLIGCSEDVRLVGVEVGEDLVGVGVEDVDLVGVEVGEDIDGVGVEVGEGLVGVVVGFGFEGF